MNTIKSVARTVLRVLRPKSRRRMYWCWSERVPKNFGDLVGPYLFEQITGTIPVFTHPSNRALTAIYISAGSVAPIIKENCIVWGSGIITRKDRFPRPTAVHAVRGPLTMNRFHELGHDCPAVFGDPGVLLPLYYDPAWPIMTRVGLIPHHVDLARVQALYENHPEVKVIDVRRDVEAVVDDLLTCQKIMSSSLHGLIFSHSYGRPCTLMSSEERLYGDDSKFLDYWQSLGIETPPEPISLRSRVPVQELEAMIDDAPAVSVKHLQDGLLDTCPFPGRTGPQSRSDRV